MFICKSKKILKNYYDSVFPWLERCEKDFGFDNLMHKLLKLKKNVKIRNHSGYWLDNGRPSDYIIATEQFKKMKKKILHV